MGRETLMGREKRKRGRYTNMEKNVRMYEQEGVARAEGRARGRRKDRGEMKGRTSGTRLGDKRYLRERDANRDLILLDK